MTDSRLVSAVAVIDATGEFIEKRLRSMPKSRRMNIPAVASVIEAASAMFKGKVGDILGESAIIALIHGMDYVLEAYEPAARRHIPTDDEMESAASSIRFDNIPVSIKDVAHKIVRAKEVVSKAEFNKAVKSCRHWGKFASGEFSRSTAQSMKDAIVETIADGPSLVNLKAKVSEKIAGVVWPRMESVFRGAYASAMADGEDLAYWSGTLKITHPYVRYAAIMDARARENHKALETMGIGGSAIFRADDPVAIKYRPPWDWNCRCTRYFLTIEQAAELGVPEAVKWFKTGRAPVKKAFVKDPGFQIDPRFIRPASFSRA
jgi:hypothetical protein